MEDYDLTKPVTLQMLVEIGIKSLKERPDYELMYKVNAMENYLRFYPQETIYKMIKR